MRVRCRATADYRSNAVGSLELECKPEGLGISLRGVSHYREGYAPGPPVDTREVLVPWASVYATRLGEDELLLSVAAAFLPLNRYRLGEFREVRVEDPAAAARRRRLLLIGSAAALLIALSVVLGLRGALPQPQLLRTLAAALVLAAAALFIARRASRGRPHTSSDVLRELAAELASHLPTQILVEPSAPPPRAFQLPDVTSFLPRSALAVAITLAATSLAALLSSTAALPEASVSAAGAPRADGQQALAPAAPPSAPRALPAPAATDPPAQPLGASCTCARAESLLWREPLPRLSPLVLTTRSRAHEGHEHMELDVALVNDGDRPATRAELAVLFFEERAAGGAGQRQTAERRLALPTPLAPGGVMRWHVEARGSTFDLVGPELGTLAPDGSDAAPVEAFAALSDAQPRALAMHAALLLAFLGDARAQGAARALEAGATASERAFLERILAAEPPVAACALALTRARAGEARLSACLENRSDEPRAALGLRLSVFDAGLDLERPGARSPSLLGEQRARVDARLPARGGRELTLELPLELPPGASPRAFELTIEPGVGQ